MIRWRPNPTLLEQRGTSLLELLTYIAVFAVILNIAAQTLITCSRLSSFGTTVADRIGQTADVEHAFREVVAEGCAVVKRAGPFVTGPTTVVLQRGAMSADDQEFLVFGAFRSPTRISQALLRINGTAVDVERLITYPLDIASVTFGYDNGDSGTARLIRMDLVAPIPGKRPNHHAVQRSIAAIRGIGESPIGPLASMKSVGPINAAVPVAQGESR